MYSCAADRSREQSLRNCYTEDYSGRREGQVWVECASGSVSHLDAMVSRVDGS